MQKSNPTNSPTSKATADLYQQAVVIVTEARYASYSLLQRHLRIGYSMAVGLMEALVAGGVVSEVADSNHRREVLLK